MLACVMLPVLSLRRAQVDSTAPAPQQTEAVPHCRSERLAYPSHTPVNDKTSTASKHKKKNMLATFNCNCINSDHPLYPYGYLNVE